MPRPRLKDARRDSINMNTRQKQGQYADVIEYAYANADACGSAVNAVAQAVRESKSFQKWAKSRTSQRKISSSASS